jgi:hypothetical protein
MSEKIAVRHMSLVVIQKIMVIIQLLALLVPFLLLAFYIFRKQKLPNFFTYLFLSSVLVSFLMTTPMLSFDFYLGEIVEAMDGDGNGMNSPAEAVTYTTREIEAYEMHIRDGGRNVFILISPIMALAYSFLISVLVYASLKLWRRVNA